MPVAVHVQLLLRIVGDDGTVFTDSEILRLEKSDHRLEALGLSISEGNTLHERLQQHIVTAQAAAYVNRHHAGRVFNTPQVVVATHIQWRFLGELTCRACEYGRWVAGWEG
jgi:hypothetical protein